MNKFCLILGVLLTGCQATPEPTEINLPEAPVLKMRPVKWKVISHEGEGYMCLRPDGYSNLSLNTNDVKAFIIYQNKVIQIYKYRD